MLSSSSFRSLSSLFLLPLLTLLLLILSSSFSFAQDDPGGSSSGGSSASATGDSKRNGWLHTYSPLWGWGADTRQCDAAWVASLSQPTNNGVIGDPNKPRLTYFNVTLSIQQVENGAWVTPELQWREAVTAYDATNLFWYNAHLPAMEVLPPEWSSAYRIVLHSVFHGSRSDESLFYWAGELGALVPWISGDAVIETELLPSGGLTANWMAALLVNAGGVAMTADWFYLPFQSVAGTYCSETGRLEQSWSETGALATGYWPEETGQPDGFVAYHTMDIQVDSTSWLFFLPRCTGSILSYRWNNTAVSVEGVHSRNFTVHGAHEVGYLDVLIVSVQPENPEEPVQLYRVDIHTVAAPIPASTNASLLAFSLDAHPFDFIPSTYLYHVAWNHDPKVEQYVYLTVVATPADPAAVVTCYFNGQQINVNTAADLEGMEFDTVRENLLVCKIVAADESTWKQYWLYLPPAVTVQQSPLQRLTGWNMLRSMPFHHPLESESVNANVNAKYLARLSEHSATWMTAFSYSMSAYPSPLTQSLSSTDQHIGAGLEYLTFSHGHLRPAFSSWIHLYGVLLPYEVSEVTFTPSMIDVAKDFALYSLNDRPIGWNTFTCIHHQELSRPLPLTVGENHLRLQVYNPDTEGYGVYEVILVRLAKVPASQTNMPTGELGVYGTSAASNALMPWRIRDVFPTLNVSGLSDYDYQLDLSAIFSHDMSDTEEGAHLRLRLSSSIYVPAQTGVEFDINHSEDSDSNFYFGLLTDLGVSIGQLSPAVSPTRFEYNLLGVPAINSTLILSPYLADSRGRYVLRESNSLDLFSLNLTSGRLSRRSRVPSQVTLQPGVVNRFEIEVWATKCSGPAIYVINVLRESADATLAVLEPQAGLVAKMTPAFNATLSTVRQYQLVVSAVLTQLQLSVVPAHPAASWQAEVQREGMSGIAGFQPLHPTSISPISLMLDWGQTLVRITVISEDRSATNVYLLTVIRQSDNSQLRPLKYDVAWSLSPAFDPESLSYRLSSSVEPAPLHMLVAECAHARALLSYRFGHNESELLTQIAIRNGTSSIAIGIGAAAPIAAVGPVFLTLPESQTSVAVRCVAEDESSTHTYVSTFERKVKAAPAVLLTAIRSSNASQPVLISGWSAVSASFSLLLSPAASPLPSVELSRRQSVVYSFTISDVVSQATFVSLSFPPPVTSAPSDSASVSSLGAIHPPSVFLPTGFTGAIEFTYQAPMDVRSARTVTIDMTMSGEFPTDGQVVATMPIRLLPPSFQLGNVELFLRGPDGAPLRFSSALPSHLQPGGPAYTVPIVFAQIRDIVMSLSASQRANATEAGPTGRGAKQETTNKEHKRGQQSRHENMQLAVSTVPPSVSASLSQMPNMSMSLRPVFSSSGPSSIQLTFVQHSVSGVPSYTTSSLSSGETSEWYHLSPGSNLLFLDSRTEDGVVVLDLSTSVNTDPSACAAATASYVSMQPTNSSSTPTAGPSDSPYLVCVIPQWIVENRDTVMEQFVQGVAEKLLAAGGGEGGGSTIIQVLPSLVSTFLPPPGWGFGHWIWAVLCALYLALAGTSAYSIGLQRSSEQRAMLQRYASDRGTVPLQPTASTIYIPCLSLSLLLLCCCRAFVMLVYYEWHRGWSLSSVRLVTQWPHILAPVILMAISVHSLQLRGVPNGTPVNVAFLKQARHWFISTKVTAWLPLILLTCVSTVSSFLYLAMAAADPMTPAQAGIEQSIVAILTLAQVALILVAMYLYARYVKAHSNERGTQIKQLAAAGSGESSLPHWLSSSRRYTYHCVAVCLFLWLFALAFLLSSVFATDIFSPMYLNFLVVFHCAEVVAFALLLVAWLGSVILAGSAAATNLKVRQSVVENPSASPPRKAAFQTDTTEAELCSTPTVEMTTRGGANPAHVAMKVNEEEEEEEEAKQTTALPGAMPEDATETATLPTAAAVLSSASSSSSSSPSVLVPVISSASSSFFV